MVHTLSVSVPSSPTFSSSPSSPTTLSSPSSGTRTNTLVITRLPPVFFEAEILGTLRSHFAAYGPIYAWAPLKAFARVMLVYYSEDDAEDAKEDNDGLVLGEVQHSPEVILRVYRADPTPVESSDIEEHNNHFLRPPVNEKNFLISPPGSPPVGWEPIREDPPNVTPLAHDLIAALRKLELQAERASRGPGLEVLLAPEEGVGIGVYVEDCDGGEGGAPEESEEDWAYGELSPARMQWRPMPTSRPPVAVMC